jgi:hypothetical protein
VFDRLSFTHGEAPKKNDGTNMMSKHPERQSREYKKGVRRYKEDIWIEKLLFNESRTREYTQFRDVLPDLLHFGAIFT